jgi:hypothetical protein
MKSGEHPNDESEFDRLLGQARWPEPRGEQIARLGERWQAIVRRRRHLMYGALAMAASVLVVVGLLASRDRGTLPATIAGADRTADTVTAENPAVTQAPRSTPSTPQVAISTDIPSKPAGWSVESRDANLYERVLLSSASSRRKPNRQQPAKAEPDKSPVEELVAVIVRDPVADVEVRLVLLQRDLARYEPALWDVARGADAERRLAAARILSRIGTARSLSVLAELTNDSATHAAAILGLGRLAGLPDLMRLVTLEPDAELRRELLRMLLARRTEESIRLYLDFVNEPRFRPDALVAAATMTDPPVDLLLAFLESPQKSLRLSAAQALGRLPDAEIAERLSESVLRGIGRQEALVALLLSPTAQAAGFLNQARQNLYLVASVQAAEQQLHALTIPERR